MHNPYEPHATSPFEARPRAPQRRGADYYLPPIGSGRNIDRGHLLRQDRIGRVLIALMLVAPLVYLLGLQFGWW